MNASTSPLAGFWMAGFEGADHVNMHGEPLDMVGLTGHADAMEADYGRLAARGFATVRESIGWRLTEQPGGRFDFARARRCARAAERHGLQVAWTLMHYGVPADVSLLDDAFCERFVAFAAAAARELRPLTASAPIYTPINEISYLAWAACESNFIHPHVGERSDPRWRPLPDGYEVKRRLVRATLGAMQAILAEDPRARFLHIDPLVHVVPPPDASPALADEARRFREFQWQAWDMLSGRLDAGLGGSPEALDLVGVNHYDTAQWEFATGATLDWAARDPRRLPFSALLAEAWHRYRRPIVVAETGHVGPGRGRWIEEIVHEVAAARQTGVPVHGVCIYPVVDRPDWNDTSDWHRSGLWDAAASGTTLPCDAADASRFPGRHLELPYAEALRRSQQRLGALSVTPAPVAPLRETAMTPTLIVFSHLRWNFVYQRPQHLLGRLAARHPVVFIEEPTYREGTAGLEILDAAPGVTVVRPHTPVHAAGFSDDQLAAIGPVLDAALPDLAGTAPLVWFYSPLALPLLDRIAARAVIYDCMDELSAFAGASPLLRGREAALLSRADLVLTGGPSLYEAKREANPRVLCLPSSVDARHFAPGPHAADSAESMHARALQGSIPEPRLGYFGVIDERMDLELVGRLADADPGWSIVMVGPVVKIDPARLPQRPNLHWLGQQPYEVLPRLLDGWQVGLMPFALNESTRYISPTKTLEYMAAGKPVVSTGIRDVRTLYGDVVRIAEDRDAFVAACRDAMAEGPVARRERLLAMTATVSRSSWDSTAQWIAEAIDAILGRGDQAVGSARPEPSSSSSSASAG